MSRVAVVGAGPAGLAAAVSAAEAGHEVVVFEADDVVGGMAGSFEVAGIRVDYGSHRLHASTTPAFLARLQSLLGHDLQARQRNGRIRLRDRWVAFPLRSGDLARRLPPSFAARVGGEAITGPLRRRRGQGFAGPEAGFVDEVRQRLGPTVTREFYEPYACKLYGVDPATLTSELARRRVSASSPWTLLAKATGTSRADGRTFYYPRRGYGQVSEALADAATAAGAQIRLGEPVTGIRAGPSPTVTTASTSLDFDVVLSTMPLPALVGALKPTVEPEVVTAAAALRSRAMVLVYLVVPRPRYTPFDAHYFPSFDIAVSRLSEPKNYRDTDDPDDVTVLCAEVPCWVGDAVWNASDADLARTVTDDLAQVGLPDPDPAAVEVRRLPAVYPVYERATEQARALVDRWLEGIPGVLTFGRQGLGVPDNLHHVLDMGQSAVSVLTQSGIDRGRWIESLNRFATNVVVD